MLNRKKGLQLPNGFKLHRTLKGHTDRITRFAWSPDGEKLATPSFDQTIRIWDSETGTVIQKLEIHNNFVTGVAWSPDSQKLASCSDDLTVRVSDANNGNQLLRPMEHPAVVTGVAWSGSGEKLASSCDDYIVRVWDAHTGGLLRELKGHEDRVLSVAWSPDGSTLASASWDGTMRLWDAETGKLRQPPCQSSKQVYHVAWAQDGRVASACFDTTLSIWDSQTGKRIAIREGHKSPLYCVSFSSDGSILAAKCNNNIWLWRNDSQESVTLKAIAEWPYSCLAFHPHAPMLAASVGNDRNLCIWKLDFDLILPESPATSIVRGGLAPNHEKNINILHLSDIHTGDESLTIQHRLQLTSDLIKRLDIEHLHYLVISGDIADRSLPSEYASSAQLINGIANKFQLEQSRIILAPGNHDLNWDSAEEAYKFVFKRKLSPVLPDADTRYIKVGDIGVLERDEERYKKRFDNFSSFYRRICGRSYPLEYDEQGILHLFEDHRILFLTLNSSWNLDSHYTSRHGINMDAFARALDRQMDKKYDGWLKIAVWHHPVFGQEAMDTAFLQQLATNGFEIVMHGHIHRAFEEHHKPYPKQGIRIVGAGAFSAPPCQQVPGIPLSYNLLVLDPVNRIATVHTRKKDDPHGAWSAYAIWGKPSKPDPYYSFKLKNW